VSLDTMTGPGRVWRSRRARKLQSVHRGAQAHPAGLAAHSSGAQQACGARARAGPLCRAAVPGPCAEPLCRAAVPGHCAGPLCRATVQGRYAGPLCRAAVQGRCAGPLCRAAVQGRCGGPLCRAAVQGHCAGPLCRAAVQGHCAGPLCRAAMQGHCAGPLCRAAVPATSCAEGGGVRRATRCRAVVPCCVVQAHLVQQLELVGPHGARLWGVSQAQGDVGRGVISANLWEGESVV